jgi:hypothetical protein
MIFYRISISWGYTEKRVGKASNAAWFSWNTRPKGRLGVRQLAAALEIANKNKGGSKLPHSKGFATFVKNYATLGKAPENP